jgi:hypothetical protein
MTKFPKLDLPKPRLNSTLSRTLWQRFYTPLPLLLCLFLSSQSLSAQSGKGDFRHIGLVAFDTGEYRHAKAGEVENLLSQLQLLPDNTSIMLEGHSHSRGSRATQQLAAIRATSLRDRLVNAGVREELISLDFDVRNSISKGQLVHGVSIYVLPPSEDVFPNSIAQSKDSSEQAGGVSEYSFIGTQLSKAKTISPSTEAANSEIILQPNDENCADVIINTGSLGANLEREIAECGYVMGYWKFGSEDELIDWNVSRAYRTTVDKGIIGVLQLIERNYQIRAHIHQLDKSIDFFPSVQELGVFSQ